MIKKKAHTAEFKFKVAIEAIKGEKTTSQLCSEYGIVNSQIFKWKKMVLDQGVFVFKDSSVKDNNVDETIHQLHATIGKLKVENDFLERCVGKRL
jgi:transposase-like protein